MCFRTIQLKFSALRSDGYECVAFNHELELGKKIQVKAAPDVQDIIDPMPNPKKRRPVQVLQRLTVSVSDHTVLHILASPSVDSYDLLAICPGSEKVFQQACSTLNVDIISVKLDERLPFKMKHAQIGQAVERGIFFEICYSPAIRDATARRNTLANALELVDVARRKNIIVSSQAEKALETRGPADVINLCHLFGLNGGQCKSTITSHCRSVLLHSAMRRSTAKGVVACEPVRVEKPAAEDSHTEEDESKGLKESNRSGGREGKEENSGAEGESEGSPEENHETSVKGSDFATNSDSALSRKRKASEHINEKTKKKKFSS